MEMIQFCGLTPDAFRQIVREEVLNAMGLKPSNKQYYTRADVGRLLHVSLPTVHRLVNEGLLKACKVGGRTLFDAAEIDASITEKKIFKYKHSESVA